MELTGVRAPAVATGAGTTGTGTGASAPLLAAPELVDAVVALWSSASGDPAAAPAPPAAGAWPAGRTPVLRARVVIEGPSAAAWSGDVVIACSVAATRRWGRHLLGLGDDEQLADDDVRDVLGEVANVVAGAVKARCAPGGLMGLPRVDDELAPLGRQDGPGVVVSTAVRWPGAADDEQVTVVALVGRRQATADDATTEAATTRDAVLLSPRRAR